MRLADDAVERDNGRPQDDSRQLLLHTARGLFASSGFGGTTTKAIARAAGVSEVTLFRQFGSKAAMYQEAVIDPLRTGFQQIISTFAQDGYGTRPHDPDQAAAYYVEHTFTFLRNHRESLLALLTSNESSEALAGADGKTLFATLFEQLERDVRLEADAHGWDHLDVPMATRITFGIVTSMTLFDDWFFGADAERPTADRIARSMAQYMNYGMTRPPARTSAADTDAGRIAQADAPGLGTDRPNPVGPAASLRIETSGSVAVVTLERPEYGNPLDAPTCEALADALGSLTASGVKAVVLTGAGDTFSWGSDDGRSGGTPDDPAGDHGSFVQLAEAIRNCPLPVIAAVNGPAVGYGFALTGLCDLVVMSEAAYFAEPQVVLEHVDLRRPILPWPFVTSLLGAKRHLMTGARIDAVAAERFGLAHAVAPAEAVRSAAFDLAVLLTHTSSRTVRVTRDLVDMQRVLHYLRS